MKPATKVLTQSFCRCIKKVRNSIKPRVRGQNKESAAIAVCTKSVLGSKKRTLRKFSCRKEKLYTRKIKN